MRVFRHLLTIGLLLAPTAHAAGPETNAILEELPPGKTLENLDGNDFKKLSRAQRDSVLAARWHGAPLTIWDLDLMRELLNDGLLTEPKVLGSLIATLAEDGTAEKLVTLGKNGSHSRIGSSLSLLMELTGRACWDPVASGREKDPAKVRVVVDWWQQWWKQNSNKHPLLDTELRNQLKRRVVQIQEMLLKDLKADYPELAHVHLNETRIEQFEPLLRSALDSACLAEGITRRDANGQFQSSDDYVMLDICAEFTTALPVQMASLPAHRDSKMWNPQPQCAFSEPVPGTGIFLRVYAAAAKSDFPLKVLQSLRKLPAPKPMEAH